MPAITVITFPAGGDAAAFIGPIHLFDAGALLEFPTGGFGGNVDGSPRTSAVTDPPSDLRLGWDTSAIYADSVDIALAVVGAGNEEPREVAVLGEASNSGSYRILASALDEFDLGDSYVFFKVSFCVRRALRSPTNETPRSRRCSLHA